MTMNIGLIPLRELSHWAIRVGRTHVSQSASKGYHSQLPIRFFGVAAALSS
jgi:hypothetical protein